MYVETAFVTSERTGWLYHQRLSRPVIIAKADRRTTLTWLVLAVVSAVAVMFSFCRFLLPSVDNLINLLNEVALAGIVAMPATFPTTKRSGRPVRRGDRCVRRDRAGSDGTGIGAGLPPC